MAEYMVCDREVKLVYFGLMPAFTGRGIGPWFLRRFLYQAWALSPRRVWLHTCTLDHPAALSTYEAAGFRPFRRVVEVQDDPRAAGLIPADAAPHVPFRQ